MAFKTAVGVAAAAVAAAAVIVIAVAIVPVILVLAVSDIESRKQRYIAEGQKLHEENLKKHPPQKQYTPEDYEFEKIRQRKAEALNYIEQGLLTQEEADNFIKSGNLVLEKGCEKNKNRSHNKTFMDEMLKKILGDKNHPLRFLVDEETKNWKSREKYSDDPTVQAGHLKSLWGLSHNEKERLAIEDSLFNQLTSNVAESGKKAVVEKEAVDIGGVPVEWRTAQMWSNTGMLPNIDLSKLKSSDGWSPICK